MHTPNAFTAMTTAADLILIDGAVHTLSPDSDSTDGEADAEAVAIRDGRIVRVDSTYEVEFLEGVETTVIDLDGRTVLPGFIDAHTHLDHLGQQLEEVDLSETTALAEAIQRMIDQKTDGSEWILGFGYDESQWTDSDEYLTRDDLDEVSESRPVAAYREDMHLASVNSVGLEMLGEDLPDEQVETYDGVPTGVLVEEAVGVLGDAVRPGQDRLREYVLAAQDYAHERGVTGVHEMVRPDTARIYRELDAAGELTLRVRLNYWADHLDAVLEAGLTTNHGSDRVRMGAIKTFTDGSIGGRTAKLTEPYCDTDDGSRGEWVTPPDELDVLVDRVDSEGLQMATHAIGDEAIQAALDAYDDTTGTRHRIEHAEVLTDELIDRLTETAVVVSAQPNFLKWAREEGLYAQRLGDRRRRNSNQFGTLHERGATLAFGSDCMPLDPLFGIEQTVRGPASGQRLSVTDAVRAYTIGGAYAAFDEHRLGTIETGKLADLVVLDDTPWDTEDLGTVGVDLTIVEGQIVYVKDR